jgi:hypothetical protein
MLSCSSSVPRFNKNFLTLQIPHCLALLSPCDVPIFRLVMSFMKHESNHNIHLVLHDDGYGLLGETILKCGARLGNHLIPGPITSHDPPTLGHASHIHPHSRPIPTPKTKRNPFIVVGLVVSWLSHHQVKQLRGISLFKRSSLQNRTI